MAVVSEGTVAASIVFVPESVVFVPGSVVFVPGSAASSPEREPPGTSRTSISAWQKGAPSSVVTSSVIVFVFGSWVSEGAVGSAVGVLLGSAVVATLESVAVVALESEFSSHRGRQL